MQWSGPWYVPWCSGLGPGTCSSPYLDAVEWALVSTLMQRSRPWYASSLNAVDWALVRTLMQWSVPWYVPWCSGVGPGTYLDAVECALVRTLMQWSGPWYIPWCNGVGPGISDLDRSCLPADVTWRRPGGRWRSRRRHPPLRPPWWPPGCCHRTAWHTRERERSAQRTINEFYHEYLLEL